MIQFEAGTMQTAEVVAFGSINFIEIGIKKIASMK